MTPGQEVSAESNLLTMTNESYYTATFATESYARIADAILWTGGGSASTIYCIANAIPISTLRSLFATTSPVPSVTPSRSPSPVASPSPSLVPSPSPSRTPLPSPSPSVTAVIIGGDVDINNDFHRGWTAYGTTSKVDTAKYTAAGLTVFGFNGATNTWYTPPGTGANAIPGFTQTESGRAYYVFSGTAKTVSLPFRPVPTTTYTLTKGWNMLYNLGDKTLSNLQLTYNNATNSAANMISSGVINPNIYIIEDDQASASCNYFSLLSSTASAANCSTGAKAHVTTLSSGKVFWIKVN